MGDEPAAGALTTGDETLRVLDEAEGADGSAGPAGVVEPGVGLSNEVAVLEPSRIAFDGAERDASARLPSARAAVEGTSIIVARTHLNKDAPDMAAAWRAGSGACVSNVAACNWS
jgi:hypothetical protein